jgi:hypothetical protein
VVAESRLPTANWFTDITLRACAGVYPNKLPQRMEVSLSSFRPDPRKGSDRGQTGWRLVKAPIIPEFGSPVAVAMGRDSEEASGFGQPAEWFWAYLRARGSSRLGRRGFELFARDLQITVPGGGFIFRQVSVGQRVGQIPAEADLFAVRHQAGDGRAVFEQNESDVLIMRAVDAIGKIARGVRHADTRLSHKIRLSDILLLVNPLPLV